MARPPASPKKRLNASRAVPVRILRTPIRSKDVHGRLPTQRALAGNEVARRRSLLAVGVTISMIVIIGIWLSLLRFSFTANDRGVSLLDRIVSRLSSVIPVRGTNDAISNQDYEALQERVFPQMQNTNESP